jgi:hypothetical protein
MRFFRNALAALALVCLPFEQAFAQAQTGLAVKDGAGASQTLCTYTVGGNQVSCQTGVNTSGSAGSITAADAATTSTPGQSSVGIITGAPTASSFKDYAISTAASGGTLTISGTFVATAKIEASYDGGTSYVAASGLLRGTGILTSTVTAPGAFSLDLNGVTNLRVRSTAYTSGTMTVNFTYSGAPGMSKILNGVTIVDSLGVALDTSIDRYVQCRTAAACPTQAQATPTAPTVPTFTYTFTDVSIGASPTDIAYLVRNSAASVVHLTHAWMTCTAASAGTLHVELARRGTSIDTGSGTALSVVKHDPLIAPAALTTANYYTTAPTVNSTVGNLWSGMLIVPSDSSPATITTSMDWSAAQHPYEALAAIRSNNEGLAIHVVTGSAVPTTTKCSGGFTVDEN